jgi:hypothetical protein
MFGRMGRAAAADVAHALEDDAGRDPGPDAVPDAEFPFGYQVHDVVRQPRTGRPAVQPVDDPVVPLHQRVGALMVGEPGKDHAHIPHYGDRYGGAPNGFRAWPAMP